MSGNEKIRLLLVDDEVKFLQIMASRLRLKSFQITLAANGQEAIDAAAKKSFDVAVIDLQMPGIDGIQLFKILKENHKDLGVIVLTGNATMGTAIECMKLGAFTFLEKSCDIEVLITAIKDACKLPLEKKSETEGKEKQPQEKSLEQKPPSSLGKIKKWVKWAKTKKSE